MSFFRWILLGLMLTATVTKVQAAPTANKPAKRVSTLPPALSSACEVEAVQMFAAILSGNPPSSGDMGWFHPGQSAYSLKWLVKRMDKDGDGAVAARNLPRLPSCSIASTAITMANWTPADFDWSDASPLNRQMQILNPFFRRPTRTTTKRSPRPNGRHCSRKRPRARIRSAARNCTPSCFPPPPPRPKKPTAGMPTPMTLVKGLFNGEIGSLHEGPSVGQLAPNFTLKTPDKAKALSLSRFRGKNPVVLVFGSFT